MPNKFFGQNLKKMPKTEKEYHHQILHIRLGNKFQLKLAILIFLKKN